MGYTIDYGKLESCATRRERDERALADLMNWFEDRPEAINELMLYATKVEEFTTHPETPKPEEVAQCVNNLMVAFGFAGVEGLPVYAFLRNRCLTAFKVWSAENGTLTDAQGFPYSNQDAPQDPNHVN